MKLTSEGAAAKYASGISLDKYPDTTWNAIARAAIEASDEVKRLRAENKSLTDELEDTLNRLDEADAEICKWNPNR